MSTLVFGKGRTQMTVSSTVRDHVERMLRSAAPRTMETLRRVTDDLRDEAAREWPVKTGRSRDGLDTMIRVVGSGLVEGVVFNRVPYAYKITVPGGTAGAQTFGPMTQAQVLRAAGWSKRDHIWSELVKKPGAKKAPDVAQALAADMRTLAGGR
jgi:hypothetical protein